MLSPNATNRVRLIRGGCWTTTLKVHESVRCLPSVAVQRTAVVPTGNIDPDIGVQLIETAGAPPLTIGVPYWTIVAKPLGDVTGAGAAGHVIRGPSG
jgi:hypothetical protein